MYVVSVCRFGFQHCLIQYINVSMHNILIMCAFDSFGIICIMAFTVTILSKVIYIIICVDVIVYVAMECALQTFCNTMTCSLVRSLQWNRIIANLVSRQRQRTKWIEMKLLGFVEVSVACKPTFWGWMLFCCIYTMCTKRIANSLSLPLSYFISHFSPTLFQTHAHKHTLTFSLHHWARNFIHTYICVLCRLWRR